MFSQLVRIREGFPGGLVVKNPLANAEEDFKGCRFDPWVGKIPWRSAWQPTPVFLPRESHGWSGWLQSNGWLQSIGSNSPAGLKRLSTHAANFRTVRELSNTFHICSLFCVCFTSVQKYWEINVMGVISPDTSGKTWRCWEAR